MQAWLFPAQGAPQGCNSSQWLPRVTHQAYLCSQRRIEEEELPILLRPSSHSVEEFPLLVFCCHCRVGNVKGIYKSPLFPCVSWRGLGLNVAVGFLGKCHLSTVLVSSWS